MKRFRLLGKVVCFLLLVATVTLHSNLLRAQVQCTSGVCVTTWHNDIGRTGQNTNEQKLTKSLVGDPTSFGKICSTNWPTPDNLIYGQPLVVTNVRFNGTSYPYVVYVATMSDTVYAINGKDCTILESQTLRQPGEVPERCADVGGCGAAGQRSWDPRHARN